MKRSLTDEQVNEARRLYFEERLTQREIAEMYRCSIVTISLWVDPNEDRRTKKFTARPNRREKEDLDKNILDVIKTLKDEGYSSMAVHKMTHIPLEVINQYYIQCPVDFDEVYSIA